jgi:hypothetical protein
VATHSLPANRELYHRTSAANAANICAGGFRRELRAFVWLTDRILGPRDDAHGDAVLVVTMPAERTDSTSAHPPTATAL